MHPTAPPELPSATVEAAPAIEVRDLRRSYGDFEAVRGISFEVRPGEVFALLGVNGEVRLTVTNDGVSGEPGSGNGLTGLRERLVGAGGTLHAGRDGDRFSVTATVPAGGAA